MKKLARERLIDEIDKEIQETERRIKDEEDKLDDLKDEKKTILREIMEEENPFSQQPSQIFFHGFQNGFFNTDN